MLKLHAMPPTMKKDEALRNWLDKLSKLTADNSGLFRTPPPDIAITQTAHGHLAQSIEESDNAEADKDNAKDVYHRAITEATALREAARQAADDDFQLAKQEADTRLGLAESLAKSAGDSRLESYKDALNVTIPFANELFDHDDLTNKLKGELFDFSNMQQELKNDLVGSGKVSSELARAISGQVHVGSMRPRIAQLTALGTSQSSQCVEDLASAESHRIYSVQPGEEVELFWLILPSQSVAQLSVGGRPQSTGIKGTKTDGSFAFTPQRLPLICELRAFDQNGGNEVSSKVEFRRSAGPALSLSVSPQRGFNVLNWNPGDKQHAYVFQVWFAAYNSVEEDFDEAKPNWKDLTLPERTEASGIHGDKAKIIKGRKVRYRVGHPLGTGEREWSVPIEEICR